MHVSHFEAGALTGQTARAKGRNTALMRDFGQRVRLVHELRELARAKELADRGGDRLAVDQVLRREVVALGLAEAFTHGALNADEAGTELVFSQFADAADAAVAEVVNIINTIHRNGTLDAVVVSHDDIVLAVAQRDEQHHRIDDIFRGQRGSAGHIGLAEAGVDLHAADTGQIVRIGREEQAFKQGFDSFFGRRLTRAHHAVDRDAGGELISRFIKTQGLGNVSAVIEFVRVERLDFRDIGGTQLLKQLLIDQGVGSSDLLTGFLIIDVLREHAVNQVIVRNGDFLDAGLVDQADVTGVHTLVARDNDLAILVDDVEAEGITLQTLRDERQTGTFRGQREVIELEEAGKNLHRGHTQSLQQNRPGHLAAAVNTEEENILRIELEVEPGAAVRNHSGREQQLAGGVSLALVIFKENARGAVQLGDDNSLRAVDDERALLGHERDLAHVDFILPDFFYSRRGVTVIDLELDLGTKAAGVAQTTELALCNIKLWLSQVITNKTKAGQPIVAGNREDRGKGGLKTDIFAGIRLNISLQEICIRPQLNIQQGGHCEDARTIGEAFPDALLFSERVRHGHSVRRESGKKTLLQRRKSKRRQKPLGYNRLSQRHNPRL